MKRILSTLLAAVSILLCAACDPVADNQGTGPFEVGLVGDSNAVNAKDEFLFITYGDFKTSYNAFGGTTMANWAGSVETFSYQNRRAVLLALGTNDSDAVNLAAAQEAWPRALGYLKSQNKCGVWFKPYQHDAEQVAFNTWLSTLIAANYPNIRIFDWNARAQGHPEWLNADGVHFNDTGQVQWAIAMEQAVALCP
jgi:lysophospholipase L1-like esterase